MKHLDFYYRLHYLRNEYFINFIRSSEMFLNKCFIRNQFEVFKIKVEQIFKNDDKLNFKNNFLTHKLLFFFVSIYIVTFCFLK